MDVIDAIKKRRSIRNFKPDEICETALHKLLNAMRLAPSGANIQPWKFIVVRNRVTKEKLAAACRWWPGRPEGQDFIAEAPVVIVACGSEMEAGTGYYLDGRLVISDGRTVAEVTRNTPPEYIRSSLPWDLAIALDHLTLAAVEEGLGTCWIGGLDEALIKEILSIPGDMRAPVVMPIGYPVSWPEPRPRKPLEEIICYDRYR